MGQGYAQQTGKLPAAPIKKAATAQIRQLIALSVRVCGGVLEALGKHDIAEVGSQVTIEQSPA